MSVPDERSVRVSTLELFFDLVFVFTITQLTGLLVEGVDGTTVLEVAVMLLLIWWMYDGYAWLTNAIATDRLRFRLLLIGGMGGFLVIALATPEAYDGDGLAFGIGYLVVILLHAGMYVRGTSVSEVRAILRIVPFNLVAAGVVLVGGALGGDTQQALWAFTAAMLWASPWLTTLEGLIVSVAHFVERHGLVVIIALGESIVAVGAAASEQDLDAGLALAALVSLGLSAALWWVYFSDEESVEDAMSAASPGSRPRLALVGFGYWHYGIILAIVAVAAGLEKAVEHPYEPLDGWSAVALAVGVAAFVACEVGFRRTFGITRSQVRLVAALAVLTTIPLGSEVGALAQVGALTAMIVVALAAEGLVTRPAVSRESSADLQSKRRSAPET
jgi:low temperature requirement protein LtrA